jgi:hypothetical protein
LKLCEIDYNPGIIWFAPSGNQVGWFNTKEILKTILPEISSQMARNIEESFGHKYLKCSFAFSKQNIKTQDVI